MTVLTENVRCPTKCQNNSEVGVEKRLRTLGLMYRLLLSYDANTVRVKTILEQFDYRPNGSHQVEVPQISRQSAHEGANVVGPAHRPPLPRPSPSGNILGTHFC